jgi:hypothetical protein
MSMSGTMVKGVGQACLAVFRARFCGYLQTDQQSVRFSPTSFCGGPVLIGVFPFLAEGEGWRGGTGNDLLCSVMEGTKDVGWAIPPSL